ncbi:hypothetical protein MGYG_06610 [Nannizzia gypsea CBS 118893]|uniref:Uncharacterized protein n=1 Tax=Arthroderma gypseum (strain ATCC MYA-4604 / CBS 118893) TaxID=535722 RepID=E4V2Q4_ARTGP|nr:hypothetical protein MGYG_06610 [Nannizzia gypsea CBS 118893]EFR03616.1 hypothetical protein MGYG_06610 [Nannizzia gypsea CBS 118893]
MAMIIAPRAPYMHPLLPSSSLEGLEQVIPPEPNSPKIYIPRWKLDKPLPSPPKRSSGTPSTDEQYLSSARYQRPNDGHRENAVYVKKTGPTHAHSVDELRLLYRQRSPVPCSPGWQRRRDRDQLSSPAKRARHSTDPVFQTCNGGLIRASTRIESRKSHDEREAPERGSASDAAKPGAASQRIRAKGIDEHAWMGENDQPVIESPRAEDNSGLCFCRLPHPRHSKIFPAPRTSKSSSYHRGVQASDLPDASSYIELIQQKSIPDVPEVNVEDVDDEQCSPRTRPRPRPQNRTQLYSFTTCASTSMINEITETSSRKDTGGFGLFRSPPLPPTEERSRRPKQLAIPPSDYQLYGVKALSKNRPKKKKSSLFYLNKLIPKAIKRHASEPQIQPLTTPRTAPPCGGEGNRREEWFGLGRNSNAWRSTAEFSREAFGSSSNKLPEQRRKEELKSKIVMVGPTPHWL